MNHGSQFLLLGHADPCDRPRIQQLDHALVEVRGCHFGCMARYGSGVEVIEPAGMNVIPRPIGGNLMIPDTVFSGRSEGSVGELEHAERA